MAVERVLPKNDSFGFNAQTEADEDPLKQASLTRKGPRTALQNAIQLRASVTTKRCFGNPGGRQRSPAMTGAWAEWWHGL